MNDLNIGDPDRLTPAPPDLPDHVAVEGNHAGSYGDDHGDNHADNHGDKGAGDALVLAHTTPDGAPEVHDGAQHGPAADAKLGAAPETTLPTNPEGGASAQAPGLSLGARLREARQSQQLTAEDVGALLKIGARKIDAIEEGRWEQLPQPPYLRGFLRNYAKILKIDAAALIDEIDARVCAATTPSDFSVQPSLRTPFPQRSRPHDSGVARFMRAGTLVFAVIAGLILWSGTESFQRSEERMTSWLANRAKPESAERPLLPVPAGPDTGATTPPRRSLEGDLPPAKVVNEPLPAVSANVSGAARPLAGGSPPPPLTLAAITSGGSVGESASNQPIALSGDLVMRFNDDSWVEVRQADGKVLMSQLNHAGAGKALDGAPPLELVIGNAPGVALQYRGTAVDLAPYTRDRVAHLTLK